MLTTTVDDEVLRDMGVSILLHRRLFLIAIAELKSAASSLSSAVVPAAPPSYNLSSLTSELKKVYYNDFEGDFTPLLTNEETSSTSAYMNISAVTLRDANHSSVISRILGWLGHIPGRYKVEKIEYVFNPGRYRMFLGQLEAIENRQQQPAFQLQLNLENSCEERQRVLDRLDTLCRQVFHNRRARIVRMWHGCRRNILPNVLSDGFAALATLDDGWYGKGMYFTSSAKYATRYCSDSDSCLIMCYILLLNPFPVVSADAPPNVSPASFRFYGKGNYRNYQCHYVPVSPVDTNPNTMDYRPPPTGTDDAICDELAVFQEVNILPQVVVHLK